MNRSLLHHQLETGQQSFLTEAPLIETLDYRSLLQRLAGEFGNLLSQLPDLQSQKSNNIHQILLAPTLVKSHLQVGVL
jgi:hypothetical protein